MRFFNVLGIFSDGMYTLISGIYNFLQSTYNYILSLNESTNFLNSTTATDFTTSIYVLAGIFMLFRVAISFLNTLIEPDRLSDKNEGAGNILKRLVITVILMVALVPNSFVYTFLDRLEDAILDENDGLISNLFSKANTGYTISKYIDDTNPFSNDYEKVDALAKTSLEIGDIVKNADGKCFKFIAKATRATNVKYESVTCPSDSNTNYYTIVGNCTFNTSGGKNKSDGRGTATVKDVNGHWIANVDINSTVCPNVVNSNGDLVDWGTKKPESNGKNTNETGKRNFSQTLLETMTTCNENNLDKDETCSDLKASLLVEDDGRKVRTSIDDEKLNISWLIAILVGIVVIIYLLILCLEVIVRNLKLMFLQMVAPIAIISYISPKDKILGEWFKMYGATYLDLFIKLISIKLAASLIATLEFNGAVEGLLLIMACLIFMKVIPTMISKIFGIDIASGTLKESANMLKRAAGIAVLGGGGALARSIATAANAKGNGKGLLANGLDVLKAATMGAVAGAGHAAGWDKNSRVRDALGFLEGQASTGVANAEREANLNEEYENYKLESEKNGQEPMKKGKWIRKNRLERRLRSYAGIPGEAQRLELEKKEREKEKGVIDKEKSYFENAEASFSSVLGAGADKVAEGETTSEEAKKARELEKISSNITSMTEQDFANLTMEQKMVYYKSAGYTDKYTTTVNNVKNSIESKIASGEILVHPNGTITGLSAEESQFVSVDGVTGTISVNTDAIMDYSVKADGISFARLQNDISDVAKKQKKVGDMDHLIREIMKGTNNEDGTENGVKSAFKYLMNNLSIGIKELEAYQLDSTLPEETRADISERTNQLKEKLNALSKLESIGNGESDIPDEYSNPEEFIASMRDQLKTLFKGGLKSQISEIKSDSDTVNSEIGEIEARIASVNRQQNVTDNSGKK